VAETVPTAEVLNNLGVAHLRTGEPGAADLFRRAVEMDSADPDLHFNLGYALWNYYHEHAECHSSLEKSKDVVLRQTAITYPAYQHCGIGWHLWQMCLDDLKVEAEQVIVESPCSAFISFLVSHGLSEIRCVSSG
jgi:hypothetical protein